MLMEIRVKDIKELYPSIDDIKNRIYLRAVREAFIEDNVLRFSSGIKRIVLIPYVDISEMIKDDAYVARLVLCNDTLRILYGNDISREELYSVSVSNTLRDNAPIDVRELRVKRLIIDKISPFNYKCITTKNMQYGATHAFLPGVLKDIAKEYNDDLYVSFTSIHEFVTHPVHEFDVRDLKDMLNEAINTSCTCKEDILSRDVYYYDKATDKLVEA